ncbi:hypothetical protein B296_00048724 [Ensete ventricosum]|uniref:Uncharacterized protein n=1 Tax=Ensete ventricosum TaxID=4639 RepID=A0A426X152_ENSVE|nr:hypothetical protein B296_00048724 [Ensete ventricosum]
MEANETEESSCCMMPNFYTELHITRCQMICPADGNGARKVFDEVRRIRRRRAESNVPCTGRRPWCRGNCIYVKAKHMFKSDVNDPHALSHLRPQNSYRRPQS